MIISILSRLLGFFRRPAPTPDLNYDWDYEAYLNSDRYHDSHLTDEQYVEALHRFRDRIESDKELSASDSNCLGDNDTEVSWGLCCADESMWPKDTQMWPDKEPRQRHTYTCTLEGKTVSAEPYIYGVKYRTKGQLCPFDRQEDNRQGRIFNAKEPTGCFYRCKVFNGPSPTKEEALVLYGIRIKEHVLT